ncbi:hypothetical protein LIA77_01108 [Sarocladium implicatum]|nr:hypothetical protein LIA77_01108 [Sarocladium implicatum]
MRRGEDEMDEIFRTRCYVRPRGGMRGRMLLVDEMVYLNGGRRVHGIDDAREEIDAKEARCECRKEETAAEGRMNPEVDDKRWWMAKFGQVVGVDPLRLRFSTVSDRLPFGYPGGLTMAKALFFLLGLVKRHNVFSEFSNNIIVLANRQ